MRCRLQEAQRGAARAAQRVQALRAEVEAWRSRAEQAENDRGTLEESLREASARHSRLARAAEESERTRASAVRLALAAEESLGEERAYSARLREAIARMGLVPPARHTPEQRFLV